MIRIIDKSEPKTVYFPKLSIYENIDIKLKDGVGTIYEFEELADMDCNPNFYTIELDVSELPDGEYTYIINERDTGLLLIGDVEPNTAQFENDNRIIQYE